MLHSLFGIRGVCVCVCVCVLCVFWLPLNSFRPSCSFAVFRDIATSQAGLFVASGFWIVLSLRSLWPPACLPSLNVAPATIPGEEVFTSFTQDARGSLKRRCLFECQRHDVEV